MGPHRAAVTAVSKCPFLAKATMEIKSPKELPHARIVDPITASWIFKKRPMNDKSSTSSIEITKIHMMQRTKPKITWIKKNLGAFRQEETRMLKGIEIMMIAGTRKSSILDHEKPNTANLTNSGENIELRTNRILLINLRTEA